MEVDTETKDQDGNTLINVLKDGEWVTVGKIVNGKAVLTEEFHNIDGVCIIEPKPPVPDFTYDILGEPFIPRKEKNFRRSKKEYRDG